MPTRSGSRSVEGLIFTGGIGGKYGIGRNAAKAGAGGGGTLRGKVSVGVSLRDLAGVNELPGEVTGGRLFGRGHRSGPLHGAGGERHLDGPPLPLEVSGAWMEGC